MERVTHEEFDAEDDFDLEQQSFGNYCREHHPGQWRVMTTVMWLSFLLFVGLSLFNNYSNANQAQQILTADNEIMAKVIDVTQILESGEYTDYSVLLEIDVDGLSSAANLDIPKTIFENRYQDSDEIPVLYVGPSEYNIKDHYERRADMFANWGNILLGYFVVFLLLYMARHFLLKVITGHSSS